MSDYLHPETLVDADGVAQHVDDAHVRLIEVDEDTTAYEKGHIEGAVNLLNTSLRREDMEALCPDKTTPIVFYCNGTRCLRSSDAIRKAMGWGYRNVFWFRGGWKEWTDKRLPVITD
jgi:rhodanese-related sulfurtransferase